MATENLTEFIQNNVWTIGLSIIFWYLIYKLVKRGKKLPPGKLNVTSYQIEMVIGISAWDAYRQQNH